MRVRRLRYTGWRSCILAYVVLFSCTLSTFSVTGNILSACVLFGHVCSVSAKVCENLTLPEMLPSEFQEPTTHNMITLNPS